MIIAIIFFQVDLTYFPREQGYQYSMTNCLLNAAIDKILPQCNCTPHSLPNKIDGLPFCTGKGVLCFQVLTLLLDSELWISDLLRALFNVTWNFFFTVANHQQHGRGWLQLCC